MITPGASPGKTKMWAAVRENGDFFTFVDHVKTNKHMFEFFSPSGSHIHHSIVYRSYTDTKHRAASSRQQSFLYRGAKVALSYRRMSVCPFLCHKQLLSAEKILSRARSFHHRVYQRLVFFKTNLYSIRCRGIPLAVASNCIHA